MIDKTDFIKTKDYTKKYRHYCGNCGCDRGYLTENSHGKKTGDFCQPCNSKRKISQNALKTNGFCKYCNEIHKLPEIGQSNNFWRWSSNKKYRNGGFFRCKKQETDRSKESWEKNKEEKKKNHKFWQINNLRHCNLKAKEWRTKNPEKVKEINAKRYVKVRANPQSRLRGAISNLIGSKLKGRNREKGFGTKFKTLNWGIHDLIVHLESKFEPGMTWENYGEWHIDHIIPDSWFSYQSIYDKGFEKSWSLDNLQPMWAFDNLSKNNRFAG